MGDYINNRDAQKSYRPKAGTMSPGLKRAREPYKIKNALVGLGLGAFAVGVWAYSISAVKQDVFDDIDEEAKSLAASKGLTSTEATGSATHRATTVTVGAPSTSMSNSVPATGAVENIVVSEPLPPVTTTPVLPVPTRGILGRLDARWPGVLDPESKTWIKGAPAVDSIGKIWKS
ncbi:hypothetical protein FA15DRAFT_589372 [Coprinopsis marcescibilis]|uniref:Cytochrome c oxidase assembly factor 3 n=1 Tax=Coprinopsis marcescibilis TaxID=230819 RepID=A0A5C3L0M4_COPMA|nr:hypothetical protein FA15DRAFT_589372 [Coprinopsis marcescibilis]